MSGFFICTVGSTCCIWWIDCWTVYCFAFWPTSGVCRPTEFILWCIAAAVKFCCCRTFATIRASKMSESLKFWLFVLKSKFFWFWRSICYWGKITPLWLFVKNWPSLCCFCGKFWGIERTLLLREAYLLPVRGIFYFGKSLSINCVLLYDPCYWVCSKILVGTTGMVEFWTRLACDCSLRTKLRLSCFWGFFRLRLCLSWGVRPWLAERERPFARFSLEKL